MKKSSVYSLILILALVLASCKLPAPATSEGMKTNPQALFTAAAQTAEAKRLQLAALTPSPLPATSTPAAEQSTPVNEEATLTPAGPVQATIVISGTGVAAPVEEKAEFVADITVPDGETHAPNDNFVKTWRFKNIGTTTWTTGYTLVFISGELMSGPPSVPLPKDVPPGESVDVSVNLIAPMQPGVFTGFWKLRNASGQLFGFGPLSADAIWVTIAVTGEPASTSTASGSSLFSGVSLALENPSVVGPCPHTFVFTAQFTLTRSATVTYSLEVGSDTGMEIKLPPPITRNLQAGTHTAVYELTFSSAINGWARLHITAPESVFSNQINFSLICQ